jgi:hypothetical protein
MLQFQQMKTFSWTVEESKHFLSPAFFLHFRTFKSVAISRVYIDSPTIHTFIEHTA